MTSRLASFVLSAAVLFCGLVPLACEPSVRCGDGTVERDGACVPATDGPVCSECGSGPACHNGLASDGSCECDDGYVPADPDDPSNLACVLPDVSDSGVTLGGDDEGGDDDDDGTDQDPYGACPSGSDAECRGDEECEPSIGSCSAECFEDQECSDPAEGTAVQICKALPSDFNLNSCVLSCAADGASCPAGMTCDDDSESETYQLCVR